MNWLSRLFNRALTPSPDPWRQQLVFPMAFVPEGLRLSEDEQLSASAVWACVRAIVDPIASSTINVFTRDIAGGRVPLPEDPIAYLLNTRPHADFTAQACKEIILTDALVGGNGFAEIVRDGSKRVAEIKPLYAHGMQPFRDPETDELYFRYSDPYGAGFAILPASDTLHIRGPSVRGLLGNSTMGMAVKAIALHAAQEKFATHYFANGAHLGGIVKYPAGLTDSARKRLSEEIQQKFGANGKRRLGIAFFEAGMEYQEIGGNANDTQIVPSRAFSVEEVARYFGVPLVRLGVQTAAHGYGTNVQNLNHQFVRDTLAPWCNRFTEEAIYKLFPQKAPWRLIEIDTAWLAKGDDEQCARTHEINIRSGVESVNEAREAEGKNGVGPGGDLHLVANNLVVLDEANLTKPEPASTDQPGSAGSDGPDQGSAVGLLDAVARYGRGVKARSADLARAGKSPEEIARNIATSLQPKALAAMSKALGELADLAISEASGDAGKGTTE